MNVCVRGREGEKERERERERERDGEKERERERERGGFTAKCWVNTPYTAAQTQYYDLCSHIAHTVLAHY